MKKVLVLALALMLAASQAAALELVRQKNTATRIAFPLINATDDVSYLSGCSASGDTETDQFSDSANPDGFADATNEIAELGTTGVYYVTLTNTEMNYDYVIVKCSCTGSNVQTLLIRTTTGVARNMATTDDGGTINVTTGAIDTVTTTGAATLANGAHGGSSASFTFGAGGSISSSTGNALTLTSTATSGSGLYATTSSSNRYAIEGVGTGATDSGGILGRSTTAGEGIEGVGGGNGHGAYFVGAGTGDGLHVKGGTTATAYGLHVEAAGTNNTAAMFTKIGTGVDIDADITGNITGNLSGSVGSVTGAVTVGTNNDKTGYTVSTVSDKTGYSLATAPPTAVEIRQEMDANSTKLANLDAAVTTRAPSSTALSNATWTDTAASYLDAAITSRSTYAGGAVASVTDPVTCGTVSDKTGYSLTSTPPTAGDIADAVWDEALADHGGVGSTGAALTDAQSGGDPWATALPGAYSAGTAGDILGNILADLAAEHGPGPWAK